MQINRFIQNRSDEGMRVAVLRVYINKYVISIEMYAENFYAQVTRLMVWEIPQG